MAEGQMVGVEELTLESMTHLASIGRIAAQWMADRGKVRPDLVGPSGLEADLQIALVGEQLEDREMRPRLARGGPGDGHPVPLARGASDRSVDRPGPRSQ